MLEAVQRVRSIFLPRIKHAEVARAMRHERDYGYKSQGGVETSEIKASPRQRSWADHVRPEASDAPMPQPPCEHNRDAHQTGK
jgi:hypothetical protein